MTRVDLHPDELFDRLRAGTLSPTDTVRLEGHCRSCAACRLELQLARAWLAATDEPSATDRAIGDAVASRMFDSAPPAQRGAGRRARTRLGIAVLGAALACSMSAAAFWTDLPQALQAVIEWVEIKLPPTAASTVTAKSAPPQPRLDGSPIPSSPNPEQGDPARLDERAPARVATLPELEHAARRTSRKRETAARSAPALQPRAAESSEQSRPLQAELPEAVSPPPSRAGSDAPEVLPDVVRDTASPTPTPEPRISNAPEPPSAPALLRAASSARSAGRYQVAAAWYGRLIDLFPASREAAAARVPYARLLCQRMDATDEGLTMFESYLRATPHGSLVQEALSGQALCLERDGRETEARSVWRRLVTDYPDSIYARRARERLATP